MKIIKPGIASHKIKRFVCDTCQCEFEADNNEYVLSNQSDYVHDGITAECICPCCGHMAYSYQ